MMQWGFELRNFRRISIGCAKPSGWMGRHPILAGFVLGAGMVAVVGLLIYWAVRDAQPGPPPPPLRKTVTSLVSLFETTRSCDPLPSRSAVTTRSGSEPAVSSAGASAAC